MRQNRVSIAVLAALATAAVFYPIVRAQSATLTVQIDVDRAADWYHEGLPHSDARLGANVDTFVSEERSARSELIITAPMAGGVGPIIIDHLSTRLADVPDVWIQQAKRDLHIAYGHTSHGSQLTTGMTGLVGFLGDLYAWNSGGTDGALDLRDTPFSGASDLGNPNWTAWADATRTYLNAHPEMNVVIWSWCGQVSSATETNISTYLILMDQLEQDYPAVEFVYMTGHLDGTGVDGNLNQRNEQIRQYCRENNRILYDFADIESYDPDRLVNYMELLANDNCDYDSDDNGSRDRNWAIDWQNTHEEGIDWYSVSAAHSQPLNGNLKAYAAWALWARLAGWSGPAAQPKAPTGLRLLK